MNTYFRLVLASLLTLALFVAGFAANWYPVQQSSTTYKIPIFMVSSTDHITGITSLSLGSSIIVNLNKNAAGFNAGTGSINEVGYGKYLYTFAAGETDTLGILSFHVTGTGCDPVDFDCNVVAGTPYTMASGDCYARLGAPAGASIAADIATNGTAISSAVTTIDGHTDTDEGVIVGDLPAAAPTAAAIASAVWKDATAGDFTVNPSIGYTLNGYTAPPTSTVIAMKVWEDLSTGGTDFGTANSIGLSLNTVLGHMPASTIAAQSDVTSATTTIDGHTDTEEGLIVAAMPAAAPTAATISTTIWGDLTTGGDFSTTNSVGKSLKTLLSFTPASTIAAQSDVTGLSIPSAATIATMTWEDLTTGADFGTTNSVGKSLKTLLGYTPASTLAAQSDVTSATTTIDGHTDTEEGLIVAAMPAAAPTAAANAAAVWKDLSTGGTDFGTANSIGLSLNTVLGHMPSSTIAAQSDVTGLSIPTAAANALAVWEDILTGGGNHFSTTNSIGKLLYGDLPASILAAQSDVTSATSTIDTHTDTDTTGMATGTNVTNAVTNINNHTDTDATTIEGDIPSAATLATFFWEDVLTGNDFGTTNSVGKALKLLLSFTPSSTLAAQSDVTSAVTTIDAYTLASMANVNVTVNTTGLATSTQQNATTAAVNQLNNTISAGMPKIIVVSPVGADGTTITINKGQLYDVTGVNGIPISLLVPALDIPTAWATGTWAILLPGQATPITLPTPTLNGNNQLVLTFGLTAAVTKAAFNGQYRIQVTCGGAAVTYVISRGILVVN